MKFLFLLLLVVLSVPAKEIKSNIHLYVTHGGLLSTVIVQHVLGSMGFRADTHHFSSTNEIAEINMILYSKKQFDPKEFIEELSLHQVIARYGQAKNKQLSIELDASRALWNIPPITEDEGAQIDRNSVASWFNVSKALGITVEAPYGYKWYPQISVLDDQMQPLLSIKESTFKDRMTFQLPEGAMYLKVSNTNGMKMPREGMWVESANNEE